MLTCILPWKKIALNIFILYYLSMLVTFKQLERREALEMTQTGQFFNFKRIYIRL